MRQVSIKMLKKQINTRINKLGQVKEFIIGSLVESKRKCGSKTCVCANGGELHSAYIITKRKNGKTKSIYIPVDMLGEVRKWTLEYKKVKKLIHEIDELSEKVISTSKKCKKATIKSSINIKESK